MPACSGLYLRDSWLTFITFGLAGGDVWVAQGEAEAIRSVYQAIHDGDPDAGLITIKYLEALQVMANGTATKIILPTELAGIAGALTGITETIRVDGATTGT